MFSSDMPLSFTHPPVVYRHTGSGQVKSSPPSSPRPSARAGLHAVAHQESWPGAGSGGCAPVSERFRQPRAWGLPGLLRGKDERVHPRELLCPLGAQLAVPEYQTRMHSHVSTKSHFDWDINYSSCHVVLPMLLLLFISGDN